MATNLTPVSEAIFLSPKHSYVVLTVSRLYTEIFRAKPKHVLSIPSNYMDNWGADYHVEPHDFASRPLSLMVAANMNRKAMETLCDDGTPNEWSLVFHMGGWQAGSFMFLHDCFSHGLDIKTTFTVVRPTKEEIRQFATKGEAAHA